MTFKSAFYRTYNYLRMLYGGVKFSSLPDVKYSIYFKKSKDSKIQIGKGFTFFSGNGLNPLSANSTSKCKITKCLCKSTPLVLRNSISFLVSH